MTFLVNWVLSFLSGLFLFILCLVVVWALYKTAATTYSFSLRVVVKFLKKLYYNFVQITLFEIFKPISRFVKPSENFLCNLFIELYSSARVNILYFHNALTSLVASISSTLCRYTYFKFNYNIRSIWLLSTVLLFTGLFFCSNSFKLGGFLNEFCHINGVFLILLNLDDVVVSTYLIVKCIYIFFYIHALMTHINRYTHLNVRWFSLFFFVLVAHTQLYNIHLFYQITVYNLLFVAVFESLFFYKNKTLYIYNYNNILVGVRLNQRIIMKHMDSFIFFTKNLFKGYIKWVPIFKKTSYFGLYKNFRNKWPF